MGTPKNIVFDWYPGTGKVVEAADANQREIVKVGACLECHSKFTFHGGNRQDTRFCVVCHSDQRKYGRTEAATTATGYSGSTNKIKGLAAGDLPSFIHRLHMGEELTKTGYNYGGIQFNHVRYPQDPRNCATCHTKSDATPQGDNWKSVPSRLACGACHDGIDWATGKGLTLAEARQGLTTSAYGHIGGAQADDAKCALCHNSTAIAEYHRTLVATTHNPTAKEGVAKFAYELSSVTVNASRQPVIKFQIKKDGTAVTALATPTTVVNTSGSTVVSPTYEPIANFAGGPSLYVAYAVAQDGISAPADFNAYSSVSLTNLLVAGSLNQGTITGPDTDGFWTATLTGTATSPITVPADAKMVTGAIIGSFTQKNVDGYPYTPANVTVAPTTSASGGVVNKTQLKMLLASGITGNTARRAIVDTAKCNKCHEQLGTQPEFHGGARNDATSCAICHNPNRASSGWSADSTAFVHAIHASSKRSVPYVWHAISATDDYSMIGYPGVLKNCEACHLPGTADFSASASVNAMANRLYRTVATGTLASTSTSAYRFAPANLVARDVAFGSGFSYNVATGVTTAAAGTTLVTSPTANACFACHDSDLAIQHMKSNGGSIYEARSTALAKSEQCVLCHATSKVADIKAMHAK
jgi:OmcA/MtrC family decaheme c-type cytochrome